jgi:hypothetical protein
LDTRFNETYSLLLAYRDHHIPAKAEVFRIQQRTLAQVRKGLHLTSQSSKKKDAIIRALSVSTVSHGFSLVEDLLRFSHALIACNDLTDLPRLILRRENMGFFYQFAHHMPNAQEADFYKLFWSLEPNEIPALGFLPKVDQDFISELHRNNASVMREGFRNIEHLYDSYNDAYNKFKHGYPFFFNFAAVGTGTPVEPLGEFVPYMKNENDMTDVGPVPIGEGALSRLRTVIDGPGPSVVSMLINSVLNTSIGCKIGGRRVMSHVTYGENALKPSYISQGDEIYLKFFRNYGIVTPSSDNFTLNLHNAPTGTRFDWLLNIPEYKPMEDEG